MAMPQDKEITNTSKAHESKILSPGQEQDKLKEFIEALGIDKISARVINLDEKQILLEESLKSMAAKMGELVSSQNQIINTLNGHTQPQVTAAGMPNLDKLNTVFDGLEKLGDLYVKYKTATNPTGTSIIDQDVINENIKDSVMGNFQIGKAVTDTIIKGLSRKTANKVISESLREFPSIGHEPA